MTPEKVKSLRFLPRHHIQCDLNTIGTKSDEILSCGVESFFFFNRLQLKFAQIS